MRAVPQRLMGLDPSVSTPALKSVNFLLATTLGRKNIISVLGGLRKRYFILTLFLMLYSLLGKYISVNINKKKNYIAHAMLLGE